jgi:anti-sigma regulatory factor (Ser/Thr protein kinase)
LHEVRLSVAAHPHSLGIVRRALDGLRERCGDEIVNRLAVICSELVTNAIRHSGVRQGEPLEVRLEVDDAGVIKGRVIDFGTGFDPRGLAVRDPDAEGGFGLQIVAELTRRWGVDLDGATEVWFEL